MRRVRQSELSVQVGSLGERVSSTCAHAQECRACGKTCGELDPDRTVPVEALRPALPPFLGDAVVGLSSGIEVEVRRIDTGTVMVYSLPGRYEHDFVDTATDSSAGTIYHIMPESLSLADEIWERYQRDAAEAVVPLFQRRALACVSAAPPVSTAE